jgi:hypothetical protein
VLHTDYAVVNISPGLCIFKSNGRAHEKSKYEIYLLMVMSAKKENIRENDLIREQE